MKKTILLIGSGTALLIVGCLGIMGSIDILSHTNNGLQYHVTRGPDRDRPVGCVLGDVYESTDTDDDYTCRSAWHNSKRERWETTSDGFSHWVPDLPEHQYEHQETK